MFILGPTAAGKTDLAINLAKRLPIDVISVDSAMIYCGMDIGTGKPTSAELEVTPHALIDILDPIESYSAAQFCTDAYKLMEQSITNNRIPLLVGGTMMYYQALQQGLSDLPVADPEVRNSLLDEIKKIGLQGLYEKLKQLDPIAASKINPQDPQRIQRALEVIKITGKPFSAQLNNKIELLKNWEIKKIALAPALRSQLHKAIEHRFLQMLERGFINEVEVLFKRSDLNLGLPAMRTVGYRQIWEYLAEKYSKVEMVEKSIAATRQLAKRQFTWMRRWNDLYWIDSDSININNLLQEIRKFCE